MGHRLDRTHHDGSALYVSDPYPDLGDTVTLFVRVPRSAGASTVHLSALHDGERLTTEAIVDRETPTETWWRVDLEVHNPVVAYRFLVDGGGPGHRWLTGEGEVAHDPLDAGDFRISSHDPPPGWAADAVFYQIFPDRFAPSDHRVELPAWALPAEWDDPVATDPDKATRQLYGGDLIGVRERLGHLTDLGINAIYLTPIFPAESNHRYNASSFDHVDPLLGGDAALAGLTSAARERGMRVIGDLTPNHCGDTHPWFRAAQADPTSTEAGFFTFYDHPNDYLSWLGYDTLPKFDHRDPELRWRLYEGPESVVARWLRPPVALDGWRMDVAQMTARHGRVDRNLAAARSMRRTLQTVNPDALLIAEHPFDASEVLMGDAYHGTMNYAGFARPVWAWMARNPDVEYLGMPTPIPHLPGPTVAATMTTFRASVPWTATLHAFNQLGSHDTARFRTVAGNSAAQLAAVGLLCTSPGLPVVFAGDEVGLTGGDPLTCRQPMPWTRVRWDHNTYNGYRRLIALRHAHPALRRGGFRWAHIDDDRLTFLRETPDERLLVSVTREAAASVQLPSDGLGTEIGEALLGGPDLVGTERTLTLPPVDGPGVSAWRLDTSSR
jgi:alpha-glucosidase